MGLISTLPFYSDPCHLKQVNLHFLLRNRCLQSSFHRYTGEVNTLFQLLDTTNLPHWFVATLAVIDVLIRIFAICWLPYNRKPNVALGWLMAIFFIPYVGFFAFLVFGSSRLPRKRIERQATMNTLMREAVGHHEPILGNDREIKKEISVAASLNYRLGALPMVSGNKFYFHPDNKQAMIDMAGEIDKAQEYVHFEFYITNYDEASSPLWDALIRAHQRGVQVRVLIDHIGSRKYPGFRKLCKMLTDYGVKWKLMLPIKPWRLQWQRPDLRNHRKIIVIDGQIAFAGSQNAIHPAYNIKKNLPKELIWKDLSFSAEGPIVEEFNAVFVSDWYSETGDLILEEIRTHLDAVPGGSLAQVVPSGPGYETENNLRLINYLINNAEQRILICSPYFVPDDTLLQALTNAAYSGIDVSVFVTEKGDQFLANMGQRSYYEQLLKAGVKINAYPGPTVLHSKFMLVDQEIAFIGSSNMDPRSFSLNHEVSSLIVDPTVVRDIEDVADEYMDVCKPILYDDWIRRPFYVKMVENLCRLWSSLL